MEIIHRISFNSTNNLEAITKLERYNIGYTNSPLPGNALGLISVEIRESDSNWQILQEIVNSIDAVDIFNTRFSEKEILEADRCRLIPMFQTGYPKPKNTWSINHETYETCCPQCGILGPQNKDFILQKDPKMGRNHFVSPFWVYEIFAILDVIKLFQKNIVSGYETRNIFISGINAPSTLISQMVINKISNKALVQKEIEISKDCTICGNKKYLPHMRGYQYYSKDGNSSEVDIEYTKEWYGDGHNAYREFLVSKKVASIIVENKLRGVQLKPVIII
jgi:hypothetical protein